MSLCHDRWLGLSKTPDRVPRVILTFKYLSTNLGVPITILTFDNLLRLIESKKYYDNSFIIVKEHKSEPAKERDG